MRDDAPAALARTDEFAGILARVAALEAALARLMRPRPRVEDDVLRELVAVVVDEWGADKVFAVAELVRFSTATATRSRLRRVLADCGGTNQVIGMTLARLAGQEVDGFALEQLERDRLGWLFVVTPVTPRE